MSFMSKDFSVMAYANGFTLWNYSSSDALATIKGANYFDDIAPFARVGDMILTVADNQSTVAPAILAVTTISEGAVSVSDFTSSAA